MTQTADDRLTAYRRGEIGAMPLFTLTPVNADVYSVHLSEVSHVGNLKHIGAVWKFKAIGYDAAGNVIPGGGPLTERHNTAFSAPDAAEVSARLCLGNAVKMA